MNYMDTSNQHSNYNKEGKRVTLTQYYECQPQDRCSLNLQRHPALLLVVYCVSCVPPPVLPSPPVHKLWVRKGERERKKTIQKENCRHFWTPCFKNLQVFSTKFKTSDHIQQWSLLLVSRKLPYLPIAGAQVPAVSLALPPFPSSLPTKPFLSPVSLSFLLLLVPFFLPQFSSLLKQTNKF